MNTIVESVVESPTSVSVLQHLHCSISTGTGQGWWVNYGLTAHIYLRILNDKVTILSFNFLKSLKYYDKEDISRYKKREKNDLSISVSVLY